MSTLISRLALATAGSFLPVATASRDAQEAVRVGLFVVWAAVGGLGIGASVVALLWAKKGRTDG